MAFNADKFQPTHRTAQGLVRAKQWHGPGDHPAVRPLEEIDRRHLRRVNLPAYEAAVKGELHVGYLEPSVGFVFPGQWIWQDAQGDVHLRDDEVHSATAIPLPGTEGDLLEEQAADRRFAVQTPASGQESDRPQKAGTIERPPEPLTGSPTPRASTQPAGEEGVDAALGGGERE